MPLMGEKRGRKGGKASKPQGLKRARRGNTKGGIPYASGVPSPEAIEAQPTLLSGTGRGNPACPTLKVPSVLRPPFVSVVEGENGAIRATVREVDVTGILRWIGQQGYSWHVAATWLTEMGIPLRRNTIVSQVSAGSGYDPIRWGKDRETLRGPIPDVDSATASEIKRVARGEVDYAFDV